MQPLTAPPRAGLTEQQVRDLLTGDELTVATGLELLNDGQWVDISDDLVGGNVTHEGRDVVHGKCSLQLQRALAWGRDRIRPYMVLSNAAVSARFNLGAYVLTTPQIKRGETPITYDVQGYDLLQPLLDPVGDTYVVYPAAGTDAIGNSGFETNISGWESNGMFGTRPSATLAQSTLHPSAGTKSMQITWFNDTATTETWVNTLCSFIIGKTYKFTVDAWVPTDGPDTFRFEIAFVDESEWFVATKGANNHWEWLWTATVDSGFPGLATKNTTAGTKTWIDEFHAMPLATTCLDAVRAVLEIAGAGAPLLVDGTQQPAVLAGPMVWALTDQSPTSWLDVINDLLDAIAYRGLWVDQDGNYRTEPYVDPKTRDPEWTFDLADVRTNLVGDERTIDEDVWDSPNWWRFVRRGMTVAPAEGAGIYTVPNDDRGPSSRQSIGRYRRKVVFLDAVDQASLVAQGKRIVIEDTASTRTVTLSVDPLPIAGHLDVVTYVDDEVAVKAEVISWQLNFDGSPGRWVMEVMD